MSLPQVNMYLNDSGHSNGIARYPDMKSALAVIDRQKMREAAAERKAKRARAAQSERSGKG